jgi:hypothetical protein
MRTIDVRKLLSVVLTCMFTCTQLSILGAQATVGAITGSVRSAAGAPLSKIKMEVLDASGKVTGTTITGGDGGFSVASVPYGTYTVQCVGESGRVLGTSSLMVSAASNNVRVTCSTEAAAYPPKKKWPLLAGLGAAAVAIGAVAVVATGSDASGAR